MDVKEFLNKSYTAYHAVKYGAEMLEKAGFKKLDMKDVWRLEKNVGYYVIENGTSLFAFKTGENHVKRGGKPHRFPVAQSQRQ